MSKEWMDSFTAFITDMGKKPDPLARLLRLRSDLGFTKENCVWYTFKPRAKRKTSNENESAS